MSGPDERPDRLQVGAGRIVGPRAAEVKPSLREPGRWLVWRTREDGSMDWVTSHFFQSSARRAARIYEATGKIKGRKV